MELVIDDLSCRRGGRLVFQGLSARLDSGRALAVRGANGSGKSSLLRVLAGLVPAADGTACLGDADLRSRTSWQEQVAYAGHLDAVKPALTVADNLAVWASLFEAPAALRAEALDWFELSSIADRPAAQCSAGQKRRLGLARLVLMRGRPLWLLDEPTVSLDAAASGRVAELVRAHMADGGLALIATHVALGLDDLDELQMPGPPGAYAEVSDGSDAFLRGDWA